MSKNILHICSYYDASTTFQIQFNELSKKKGFKQTVYIPVQKNNKFGRNRLDENKNIKFVYSPVLSTLTRISLRYKMQVIRKDILDKISINKFDIIHSHSLFSDGCLAAILSDRFNIPFITSVRSTDINIFLKFKPFLRFELVEIMSKAKFIIAIAPWIRKIVKEKYIHSLKRYELLSKLRVVANPINNYWIMNKYVGNKELNKIRLIYVGDFSERKNVPTIIKATHQLKKRGVDINLTIIGDKGGDEKIVKKLSNSYITFKGRINSKQKLLEEYRKANIFIMISHKETFGLVYLEALSQGLSLIYSKNTGIDGLFKEGEVGYGVNPKSAKDVADTVLKAHKNLQIMKNNTLKSVDKFSPKIIAEKILRLYN